MKLIIQNNRVAATALDGYQPNGTEQAVLDAPADFDITRLELYRYDPATGTVVAGAAPMTHLEFLDRFTDAELAAIRQTAKTDAAVDLWLYKFERSDDVRLDDPRMIAGIEALAAGGLLAPERVAEIMEAA